MTNASWKSALFFAFLALALAGCATAIRFETQRTPALDTTGIQRVSVRPFAPAGNTAEWRTIANGLTAEMTNRLQATRAFTLVSQATVDAARQRGAAVEDFVDAEFSGRLTHFFTNTTQREGTRRDLAGNIIRFTYYQREVEVAFEYYFVRSRDGVIIGPPVQRRGTEFDRNENINALAPAITLANRAIASQLRAFERDVVVHTVRVSRSLENERDRALRPQMNAARDLARAGNYRGARDAYNAIWETHGSVAAAINVSILYEALGEVESAHFFMERVFAVTGAPRANQTLARLGRELREMQALAAFGDARTQVERVAAHAISETRRVLPAHARVSIHNEAMANQGLVNDVIDNMASGFLREGIPVVERREIDLILAEQGLHMDGSVTDRDFISIGNLAGANTIVIVGITGAGAARRLQVRVLDIETGMLRMQSGTGGEWSL